MPGSASSLPQTDDLTQFRAELFRRATLHHLTNQVAYLRDELARAEEMLTNHAITGLVEALGGDQCTSN